MSSLATVGFDEKSGALIPQVPQCVSSLPAGMLECAFRAKVEEIALVVILGLPFRFSAVPRRSVAARGGRFGRNHTARRFQRALVRLSVPFDSWHDRQMAA
ncbi:hypothetical protein FRAAL2535 [Frankia alni ACN14a]|uniref:Uncharacterized protein n=1 Tax=Frankia alni (strain DSM 45986 / CECT 9034 / ACN14a) TaxID=326424 RepID=Q0RMR5_FRAAA|nr:hypothetical protein FRAAL2535 [Frankia alni ACN14a]